MIVLHVKLILYEYLLRSKRDCKNKCRVFFTDLALVAKFKVSTADIEVWLCR